MSKYDPLWKWINKHKTDDFKLTYAEIEKHCRSAHRSFVSYIQKGTFFKYGFQVAKKFL